jgi:anaerobic selenocysteine-containing dehydrogenase
MTLSNPALGGRKPSELASGEVVDMSMTPQSTLLRDRAPATPSGKIELYSETLQKQSGQGVPGFRVLEKQRRFFLISPSSERRTNSTFGGVDGHDTDLACEMNHTDALALGLEHGQKVRLYNGQGEVLLPLTLSDRVRLGTVYVPKGGWISSSLNGHTINALIPGHKADLAGGACYYDCTVDIQRCS